MAHAIGWSREDLEAPQALDTSPGAMLHPVHMADGHWPHRQHQHQTVPAFSPNTSHEGGRDEQEHHPTATFTHSKSMDMATTVPVQEKHGADTKGPRILGLRRTTFFLTASNLLLAVGLIVLGVVQSRVLGNSQSASPPGLAAQASCSR